MIPVGGFTTIEVMCMSFDDGAKDPHTLVDVQK